MTFKTVESYREILTNFHLVHRPGNYRLTTRSAHCYLRNNEIVSRVSSAQYLGITVSGNLSWNEHVNSPLRLLPRILNGCNPEVKDTTYRILIRQ